MSDEAVSRFAVRIDQIDGFAFRVTFDKEQYATLDVDEPAPLGRDGAPNAARVLAAAVGNCLAASLVFCLKRAKVSTSGVTAEVAVEIVRTETRRLRIGKIDVTLDSKLPKDTPELVHCLESFEDFCIVTQSVRKGIDVSVRHV